jgi:hypothetical protein
VDTAKSTAICAHCGLIGHTKGNCPDEVREHEASDGPEIPEQEHVSVVCWPDNRKMGDKLGIRVTAETQERADKVYSEVRARVLAEISTGLPMETIADRKHVNGSWRPTQRVAS